VRMDCLLLNELKGTLLASSETSAVDIVIPDGGRQLNESQRYLLRSVLEKTRAECDECYCDHCYKEVHSHGKRAAHKWLGFFAGASVCSVCMNSPAEFQCKMCDYALYCKSCSNTFHAMGKKSSHKLMRYMEVNTGGNPILDEVIEQTGKLSYCMLCTRRLATCACDICNEGWASNKIRRLYCNSCYECNHRPDCLLAHEDERKAKETASMTLPDGAIMCCVCSEAADSYCQQCGDYYCSVTWMGNPGCFVRYHSKGNRRNHVNVML
jgi:hypothetical protein